MFAEPEDVWMSQRVLNRGSVVDIPVIGPGAIAKLVQSVSLCTRMVQFVHAPDTQQFQCYGPSQRLYAGA